MQPDGIIQLVQALHNVAFIGTAIPLDLTRMHVAQWTGASVEVVV